MAGFVSDYTYHVVFVDPEQPPCTGIDALKFAARSNVFPFERFHDQTTDEGVIILRRWERDGTHYAAFLMMT